MKKRGVELTRPRFQTVLEHRRLRSDWLHRWDETDVWASNRALGAGQLASRFRGGATAIFFRAKQTHAGSTGNAGFFGNSFVAWNLFFDGFDHPAFAAF